MAHQLQVSPVLYTLLPCRPVLLSFRNELFDPSWTFEQHGAIRTTLSGPEDYDNDDASGFQRIEAREIDTIGIYLSHGDYHLLSDC